MDEKMFKTIVVDPPWKKDSGGVGHASLQCSTHYEVQTVGQIVGTINDWFDKFPIAPECHLYLWTTNSFTAGNHQGILPAIKVCRDIGFTPITMIPWVKSNIGNPTPYGMRYTEVCLFGVKYEKGNGKRTRYSGTQEAESVPNGKGLLRSKDYIFAPRRQHSRKPEEFYSFVESRSKGPYLELYSRTQRPGWTGLGNEAGKWIHQSQPQKGATGT